jgi:hypothetical protein
VLLHLLGRRGRPSRPKATRRLPRRVNLPPPPRCNRKPTHNSAICPRDLQFLRSRCLPAHLRRLILLPQKRQPALRRRSLLREPRPPGSQLRANRTKRTRRWYGAGALPPSSPRAPVPDARAQVDAYMFPCPQCGPPAAQVKSLFDYWAANGVNVTLLWLDIEGSQYWLGDAGQNQVGRPYVIRVVD